jgi:protein subunit release factor B
LEEIVSTKVTCIDTHPKRPWVAAAAENGVIRIVDYAANQLVHQFSLLDLETAEKNAQMLQALAEKDPSYKGPRKPESKVSKKAIGAIKVLKFVDQDIRFAKFRQEVRRVTWRSSVSIWPCTPETPLIDSPSIQRKDTWPM